MLALSSWLSAAGVLLLLRELRVPFVRAWLRRHVRFVTTTTGRTTVQFLAATLGLVSGSYSGTLLGVATLLNYAFGRHVRREVRVANRLRSMARCPPTLAAPPHAPPSGVQDREGTSSAAEHEACAADGGGTANVEADGSGEAEMAEAVAEAEMAEAARVADELRRAEVEAEVMAEAARVEQRRLEEEARARAAAEEEARARAAAEEEARAAAEKEAARMEAVEAARVEEEQQAEAARLALRAAAEEEAVRAAEAEAQVGAARAAWRAKEAAEAAAAAEADKAAGEVSQERANGV